jgi:UDP-N-acetyl-D-mannosaminuronic acid transferase (WecB/TagA/CpsF family)
MLGPRYSLPFLNIKILSTSFDVFVKKLLDLKSIKNKSVLILPTTFNEISQSFFSKEVFTSLKKFDYLVMDGMSLVFLSKLVGLRSERVCGPDLMLALMKQDKNSNLKHFFMETLLKLTKLYSES